MNNIIWKFAGEKINENIIKNFEKEHNIVFPRTYTDLIKKYNGATPNKEVFLLSTGRECVFNYLLDWNENVEGHIQNIYSILVDTLKKDSLYPFANDPFGNFICFDFTDKNDPSIVFFDHESNEIIQISKDFNSFLNSLR